MHSGRSRRDAGVDAWQEASESELPPRRRLGASAGAGGAARGSRSIAQADFVLGICVRRHMTGFALLAFDKLTPLQFGLVDVRKSSDAQQKALEIAAVLRELRQAAPEKLAQMVPEDVDDGDEDDDDADFDRRSASKASSGKNLRWSVSFDDSTVDRASPRNMSQTETQQAIAMLQGLIIADCKRLFKVAPVLVHPRQSRLLLGIRGRGADVREKVYKAAMERVRDFPEVTYDRSGRLKEDTLLMSDAWAAARHAQRAALVADLREDKKLMKQLKREIMLLRPMKRLRDAAAELHPRKAGQELSDVLESRVEQQINQQLYRLIEQDEGGPGSGAIGRSPHGQTHS